jgi:hypothetical protein
MGGDVIRIRADEAPAITSGPRTPPYGMGPRPLFGDENP